MRHAQERALLIAFNQGASASVNTSLRVPLYYSGLDTSTQVSRMGGPPFEMPLRQDWSDQVARSARRDAAGVGRLVGLRVSVPCFCQLLPCAAATV